MRALYLISGVARGLRSRGWVLMSFPAQVCNAAGVALTCCNSCRCLSKHRSIGCVWHKEK